MALFPAQTDATEHGEMMFQRLFGPSAGVVAGRTLYTPLIEQARTPAFYTTGGVPDTNEGRFELYALHLALVVRRLRGAGAFAEEASQALFDTFLQGLDDGLREIGIGDLTVPKKMRKLGAALYGRFKNYDAALAEGAAEDELGAILNRTVYADVPAPDSRELVRYVRAAAAALAATPLDDLFAAPLPWPEVVR
jgi:cytochrome b pre-mRNA-processing protein 3